MAMDFQTLMNIASVKQDSKDKIVINRYSSKLPPPKKEMKDVEKSEVIRKMIQDKEREQQMKEQARKDREKERVEKERAREREEKKKSQFRIPKKEPEKKVIDTEKLISSLFDDDDDDDSAESPQNCSSLSNTDSGIVSPQSISGCKDKHSSSSNTEKGPREDYKSKSSQESIKSQRVSSEKKSHSSSGSLSSSNSKSTSSSLRTNSSSSSSKSHSSSSSKSHSSSSSKPHSSSSSKPHSSSSSKPHSSSSSKPHSSSSSKPHSSSSSKPHSSSSSNNKSSSSSSSLSSKSKSNSSSSSSSSSKSKSNSLSSSSKSKSSSSLSDHKSSSSSSLQQTASPLPNSSLPHETKLSTEQPITLSKHHLKPVSERQVDTTQMSEKEKILAKLQAIKERTRAAINKEQESKSKRSRVEKGPKRSSRMEVKDDERVKSKEIVKDDCSSDEESENKGIPSALDIMLSERQTKLEKEKITRLAKQAWERATKKEDDTPVVKKRVHKKHSLHRVKASSDSPHRRKHSISPDRPEKKLKVKDEQRKKPKLVRHAGHAAPPPPDFKAILAMAEQKVKEPMKSLPTIPKKKKKEEDRPLTQEEKERKERIKSKEYKKWLKFGGKCPNTGKEYSSDESDKDVAVVKTKDVPTNHHQRENGHSTSFSSKKDNPVIPKSGGMSKHADMKSGSIPKSKHIPMNENVLVCGPSEDSDHGGHSQSENPFDRIYKSVHKKKSAQPAVKGRRLDDDFDDEEEEEESDLEGFIDDREDDEADYSKHISKIFGYNKRKYKDEDDDLSNMEASYATMMKEEQHSAKIGRMEDLEDMRREEEELKRKAHLKKKMKR